MKNPLPDLSAGKFNGSYFTINLHGADLGADGVVRGEGNGVTISATPIGLAVMMTKVREPALLALWKFLSEGHVTLVNNMLRVEVSGWGVRWLKANGFSSSQAQNAIADLRDIGWVRVEDLDGNGPIGQQTGVLTGAVYGSGEVFMAPERKNPLPATASESSGHRPSLSGLPGHRLPAFAQVSPLSESSGQWNQVQQPDSIPNVDNVAEPERVRQIAASESSGPESSVRTSTKSLPSKNGVLQWHLIINEKPVLPRNVILEALGEPILVAAISSNPTRAVTLIAGMFKAVDPDYPNAAAKFAGLGVTNALAEDCAAEQLAAHIVACLLLKPDTTGVQAVARLRAEIRSQGIYIKDSELPDDLLPRAWALALIHAGSTKMGDPKKYLHAALHRKEWKTGDALVRFAGAICALTSEPLGAQLIPSQQEQPPQNLELDLIIEVLAEHFQPHPDDLHAWKGSPRRRKTIIAEFIEQTGITPQEAARTRSTGGAAPIGAPDIPSPPNNAAGAPATCRPVDAETVVLVAAAIAGTRYDTEAGYQMVMDSPDLRDHVLSRRFRDTECADWDPVQDAHQIDRQQVHTA